MRALTIVSALGRHLMALAAFLLPLTARAASYALLTPPSSLEAGCFGPCACPITSTTTYGSFDLVYTGSDPLYSYYDVQRYIASFNNGPGAVAIIGSGTYRIGGEFALVQELTLDLTIWGQPAQHFDSGLIPVGAPFPRIDASCALHDFSCEDSVVVVDAVPIDVAGNLPPPPGVGLQAVWPNPSSGAVRIAFALDRPGPLSLTIVDLEGRRVRALVDDAEMPAGAGGLDWDGRRDDGRVAPAGIYWALMRWSAGVDERRIVKLR